MRVQWGRTSITFGKPPYPRAEDRDPLSRLALAYGVRRDMDEVSKAVRASADLPGDHKTDRAIRQVLAAVINAGVNDPDAVDRLAGGKGISKWAREMALSTSGIYVQPPEPLVDRVLDDFQAALSRHAT